LFLVCVSKENKFILGNLAGGSLSRSSEATFEATRPCG